MNKNLERENGQPFEGLRENADFWRWLLTTLRDEPMWIPPALRIEPNPDGNDVSSDPPAAEVTP